LWRTAAIIQAMITAGLTAVWFLLGAPDRYSDLPGWFQVVLPVQMAAIIGWVIIGSKAARP
jgi:hypothetical protein